VNPIRGDPDGKRIAARQSSKVHSRASIAKGAFSCADAESALPRGLFHGPHYFLC
jgi:hypothetical protein